MREIPGSGRGRPRPPGRRGAPGRSDPRLERDDFSSNRHLALTYSWSMIFFRKPVSTFRDHALERDDFSSNRHLALSYDWKISAALADSSRSNASNSAGLIDIGSAPRSTRRAGRSGVCRAFNATWFSFCTMSLGVREETSKPTQKTYSAFATPASAKVGTSGNWLTRLTVFTARGRSFPSRMSGSAETRGAKK